MTLDADAVLWALRGLHDPQSGGIRADHVARFMSKDATLSEDYSSEDVTVILESLVAEGTLTHAPTTGADELDESEPSDATMLYRFASDSESFPGTEPDGWDVWLGFGADELQDGLRDALTEDAAADIAATNASLRKRVEEVERERDALTAERESLTVERDALIAERDALIAEEAALTGERDSWRRRAESAQQEVSRSHDEGDELRTRVRELEHLLKRERVLASERSETARRAAAGLARARQELERLEHPAPDGRAQSHATRHRKTFRGNWLQ